MRPVNKRKPEDCGTDDFVIKKTKVYLLALFLLTLSIGL